MKEQIEKLIAEKSTHYDRIRKIDKAIEAFRDVCTHKHDDGTSALVCEGRSSHGDHYGCSICGQSF